MNVGFRAALRGDASPRGVAPGRAAVAPGRAAVAPGRLTHRLRWRLRPTLWCAVWGAAVGLVSGCGGSYDASVSGVVTLDGTAIPRGTIKYNPVGEGPASYGLINSDGSYGIMTGREAGLPSGDYTITVVANEPSVQVDQESGLPPRPGKAITPPWYRAAQHSPLRQSVASGSNTIDVELSSTPPPTWQPAGRRSRR